MEGLSARQTIQNPQIRLAVRVGGDLYRGRGNLSVWLCNGNPEIETGNACSCVSLSSGKRIRHAH